jgi:hypothetical protein
MNTKGHELEMKILRLKFEQTRYKFNEIMVITVHIHNESLLFTGYFNPKFSGFEQKQEKRNFRENSNLGCSYERFGLRSLS